LKILKKNVTNLQFIENYRDQFDIYIFKLIENNLQNLIKMAPI